MISTSGLPVSLALKLVEREADKFTTSVEKNAQNAREINAFRERIGSITTVDELVADYEVYSFVMKAFDLEDQMFGKAMMKNILKSDGEDKTSLVNKLTDSRFKELFKTMGFAEGGTKFENGANAGWIDSMVERYVDQKVVNAQLNDNEPVGLALHARNKAPTIKTWYNVLADTKLQDFFYTALNIPDAIKNTDVDKQVDFLKKKLDIETLNDDGVMDKLMRTYSAIAQAKVAAANMVNNPVLQLLTSSEQQQSIVSINLSGLTALNASRYGS